MRALPFVAPLLLLASPAMAKGEPKASGKSTLEKQCEEQERQIRELEEENSRLKSLLASSSKTTPAEKEEKPVSKPQDASPAPAPAKAIVRNGDTWVKMAKRYGTTDEELAKLNKRKTSSELKPGQELQIPVVSEDKESTHLVKEGETFYSIGKHYGLGAEAIQDANPSVKPDRLRGGMVLKIRTKTLVAKAGASEPAKSVETKKDAQPAGKSAEKRELAKADKPGRSSSLRADSTAAAASKEEPTVVINEKISFESFAQAHGTTPEKLNALNGLNLNPGTVLAEGSELRIPAQP